LARAADVDAALGHGLDGEGVDGGGLEAGAERFEAIGRQFAQERLSHLTAATVVDAHEQHPGLVVQDRLLFDSVDVAGYPAYVRKR
jgi:hypothetical protein